MKLLLHRSHRRGLFHPVIYAVDVRAQFSDEEYATISYHGLATRGLYSRSELADRGRGLMGILYRLAFGASNLTVQGQDLIVGKRIEAADIVTILSIEDQLTAASRTFHQIVIAAANYDGDQVVEL
jgi:hypothetical protein